jgi:hypothetical protein
MQMTRQGQSRYEQFVQAWAGYIDGFLFDLFVTLTFAKSSGHAEGEGAWKGLNHYLREVLGHRVEAFRVSELQPNRRVVHFHALMGRCDYRDGRKLPPHVLKEWWEGRYGKADVQVYDPQRGARYYLAQKLAWDDEHRVSDVLPSRGLRKLDAIHGEGS